MTDEKMQHPSDELPSALEKMEEIASRLQGRRPAIFLDYDGVLTPIVPHPEDARITEEMRRSVHRMSQLCTVAVVSGRDLQDVKGMAAVEGIVYAGSHGFDIEGAEGQEMTFQQGTDYLPALDRAEGMLRNSLEVIHGARVERKRFAIAVHFRAVDEHDLSAVENAVDAAIEAVPGLRRTGGKKIFELRPDIDWDKGRAVKFLLSKLGLDGEDVLPFYLGDDLTDEDAFRELHQWGIGILVRDESRPTQADYALESPAEVQTFLDDLADSLS